MRIKTSVIKKAMRRATVILEPYGIKPEPWDYLIKCGMLNRKRCPRRAPRLGWLIAMYSLKAASSQHFNLAFATEDCIYRMQGLKQFLEVRSNVTEEVIEECFRESLFCETSIREIMHSRLYEMKLGEWAGRILAGGSPPLRVPF